MAGALKPAKLDSRTARLPKNLKRGRQPHWHLLVRGKVHLGYQCWPGEKEGRWVLRRYIGSHRNADGNNVATYRHETLGRADDAREADGVDVLNFDQAEAMARAMVGAPSSSGKITNITVRQAMDLYIDYKRTEGQPVKDLISRNNVHIRPFLGDLVVAKLTAKRLRDWRSHMAMTPAQKRPKGGQPKYKAEPATAEEKRRRKVSANRVLGMLKAALNYAFDEEHVDNRDAWGRRLEPFEKVGAARPRYFTIAEVKRLLNAAAPDFRLLLRAALETGCRYGELTRLVVRDFNVDADTLTVLQSKSGKSRDVILSPAGADFFRRHCAGRPGNALMFTHANGSPWKETEQGRPMRETCENARIEPAAGFHTTRHTWASLAVMNRMPLMVVARNLGHSDTKMVERHYSHLTKNFITDAILAAAPDYGIKEDQKVAALR